MAGRAFAGALIGALALAVALPCAAQSVAQLAGRPMLPVELGPRTRLLLQPPQSQPDAPPHLMPRPAVAGGAGVGFELKLEGAKRSPSQLLRLQLSSKQTLQFRPRGGGLAVTYREQF